VNVSPVRSSTITVVNKNDEPVAGNDSIAGPADDVASFAIAASTLLANDSDPDAGDTRTVSSVSATSAAGIAVSLSGSTITYAPGTAFRYLLAGQTYTDSFSYSISDAGGRTSTATISLTVTGLNDTPVIGITWLPQYAGGVIREGVLVNTPVAVLTVADDNAQGTHTFTVSDPALKALWNATAGRYELQVANGYDYETIAGTAARGGPDIARGFTVTASDGSATSPALSQTAYVRDEEVVIFNGAAPVEVATTDAFTGWSGWYSTEGFAAGYYLLTASTWTDFTGTIVITQVRHDPQGNGINTSDDVVIWSGADIAPGYYYDIGSNDQYPSLILRELPIVLDLDGDGLDLVNLADSNVMFDQGADGTLNRTAWVAASDGILVLDRNGNGTIDNSLEISFVGDKAGAKTDLEGLAGLDSDGDGRIASGDSRFAELKVWQDLNQDGISQAGELKSLSQAGIRSIDLVGISTGQSLENTAGNVIFNVSRFTRADGSMGMAGDVALAYEGGPAGPAAPPASGSAQTPPPAAESASTPPPAGASAAAPASGEPAEPAAPAFVNRPYDRKSKHYRMVSENGSLMVVARKAKGGVDPRASAIGPASQLDFGGKRFGMLAPIILDLDGDGVEMRSIGKSRARFDMNGDGVADDTGWTGKGDGFLVIDRNGDGRIAGPSELSFLAEKAGARSDLEALSALDSNRDGKLDSGDSRFAELQVWRDADGDGVTDAGELKSLADHGIASIGLAGQSARGEASIGDNILLATATFTRTDGSLGTVGDAALAFRPSLTAGGGSFLERQLRALRQQLGTGSDLPSDQGPAPVASPDSRLALIAQEMASFGTHGGEGEWNRRNEAAIARFDYFSG
jgi:VCBS repeat-containing protein